MRCADAEKLAHPYVDGELDAEERGTLEEHVGACARCRELIALQASFRAALKTRLRRPAHSPELRRRVLAALDRADAAAAPRRLLARAAPVAAVVAAAALVVVLLGTLRRSHGGPRIVEEAIRGHEKNLPVEVGGGEDNVRVWMSGKVPVPVRPPRLRHPTALLVGARVGHLRQQDAAQLQYRVGDSQLTVYVFDPSGVEMSGPKRRVIRDREFFVDGARGYNVVLYRERGVGYALTSDLDSDEMVRLVSTSLPE